MRDDSRPADIPARRLPGRYPLLWVLAPLIAGYLVAMAGWTPPRAMLLAVPGLAAGAWFFAKIPRRWMPFWTTGVLLLSASWYDRSRAPVPDRAGLPPREAVLTVRVDELFQGTPTSISGIGRVTDAPVHLREMEGARLAFRTVQGKPDAAADVGATLTLRGVLENVPDADGFSRYLRRRGVSYTFSRAVTVRVDEPPSRLRRACTEARGRVSAALAQGVDARSAARLSALMLGRTSLLPKAEREDFRKSAATHLFAISGLHITGMAAGMLWASRRLRIAETLSAPATLAILAGYVLMAGAPASAMRAWIMTAALFLAKPASRPARPATGLALGATVTLIVDPAAARDPGFLLSYVVVAVILFYAVPLAAMLEERGRPWRFVPPDDLGRIRTAALAARRAFLSAFATTFAATLSGMPLAAVLFGTFTPVGLPANLALVPLSGPPVILGFISSTLGVAGLGAWSAPFNRVASWFLSALAEIAHVVATIPGGSWTCRITADWAVAAAALTPVVVLLAWPVRPDRSWRRVAAMPAAALLVTALVAVVG